MVPASQTMNISAISRRFAAVAALLAGRGRALGLAGLRAGVQVVAIRHRSSRDSGLTQEQSTQDRGRLPEDAARALRQQKDALDKAEADFNQMVEASDDAQVMAQVTGRGGRPLRVEQVADDDAAAMRRGC